MTDQTIRIILQGDGSQLGSAAAQGVQALGKLGTAGEQAGQRVARGSQVAALSMRQISPQLTDIVTQLQGGQNPFTVLLQQGGQLKDMAGGFGPLFRSLATAITPATLAVAGIGTAAGAAALAFYQGAQEAAKLRDNLALTGNFAGVTAGSFSGLAERVAQSTGATVASSREIGAALVASGRFSAAALESVTTAAQRVAQVSGAGAKEVVADFTDMANGAADWATKHNQSWHFATAAQIEYIRQLEETGQQQRAFVEVGRLVTEHLQGQQTQLGYLERMWRATANAASEFWDAAKGWGRGDGDTPEARLKALREQLDGLRLRYPKGIAGDWANDGMASVQAKIDTTNRDLLRQQEGVSTKSANAQAEQDAIKRRDALRLVTERLSGASSEYARTLRTIQEAAKAGDITEAQRLQLLTEAATKYGSGVKGAPKADPEKVERDYRMMVEETLKNRAPRLADIEAAGYGTATRAGVENEARTAEELRRRNGRASDMAAELQQQAAQINAGLITDEQQRAQALLEIDRQSHQARIDELASQGADVRAANDSLAAWVVARQAQMVDQLKPQWQRMVDEWGNTTRTMRQGWDAAISNMLEGAAAQFGRWASGQGGSLKSVFQSFAAQIAESQFKAAIGSIGKAASNSGGWASAIASLFGFAKGGVFAGSPGLHAYANQVVNQPTVFAFAKGAGLMGEAGPEAIMPLRRGPGGRLGVEVSGGRPSVSIEQKLALHIDARSDQAQVATLVKSAVDQGNKELVRTLKAQGVL